jgi:hypothetical protein
MSAIVIPWIHGRDLSCAVAAHLVKNNDVHHSDAVPGDAGPAATDPGRLRNMLRDQVFHESLGSQTCAAWKLFRGHFPMIRSHGLSNKMFTAFAERTGMMEDRLKRLTAAASLDRCRAWRLVP